MKETRKSPYETSNAQDDEAVAAQPGVERRANEAAADHVIGKMARGGSSEEALQAKFDQGARAPNQTGMPDQLKERVEAASGHDLSDVRVHHGSDEPAKVRANAFARGSEIHLGPGQEQHLAHEAWHVVQQKEGRVKPTLLAKGAPVNADPSLEAEADREGARAASGDFRPAAPRASVATASAPMQLNQQAAQDYTPTTARAASNAFASHLADGDFSFAGALARGTERNGDHTMLNLSKGDIRDAIEAHLLALSDDDSDALGDDFEFVVGANVACFVAEMDQHDRFTVTQGTCNVRVTAGWRAGHGGYFEAQHFHADQMAFKKGESRTQDEIEDEAEAAQAMDDAQAMAMDDGGAGGDGKKA